MEFELLRAIQADPHDEVAWYALADWFEEQSDPRAELVRITKQLRQEPPGPPRVVLERRLRELLRAGILPCTVQVSNSIGMILVLIPSGRFLMGSPFNEPYHSYDEGPVHEVILTQPYYLGMFPVTQSQFLKVMRTNPSHFSPEGPLPFYRIIDKDTGLYPVDNVSFDLAEEFCFRLSELPAERKAHRRYRLPTEAEWEYACRAGTSSVFYCGDSLSSLHGNFDGNYPYGGGPRSTYLKHTCPVGEYPPNPFGLHDLYGNVWEWCSDWFSESYYSQSPLMNPPGPPEGLGRVLRGGSWIDAGWHCRSADRSHREALHYVGFRVAMVVE